MPAPNVRAAFSITAQGEMKEKNYSPYLRDGVETCAVLDGDYRPMKKTDYSAANKKFDLLGQNDQDIYADSIRDQDDKKRKGLFDKLSPTARETHMKGLQEVGLTYGGTDTNAVKDRVLNGGGGGREAVWSVAGRPVIDSLMKDVSVVSFNEGGNLYAAGRMAGAFKESNPDYIPNAANGIARETGISREQAAQNLQSPAAQKFRQQQSKGPGGATL